MSERVDQQVDSSPFTRWDQPSLQHATSHHTNTRPRVGAVLMQGYLDYYTRWIPSTRFRSSYVRWAWCGLVTRPCRRMGDWLEDSS